MRKIRIYSFCKLDNEDILFIRKKYDISDETLKMKNEIAQQQAQMLAMQEAMEQQDYDIQSIRIIMQQQQAQIQALQKTVGQQQAMLEQLLPSKQNADTVQNKQPDTDIKETDEKYFEYTKTGDTVTITNYIGEDKADKAVVIPRHINGKDVNAIGDGAFWYCSNITEITIQSCVTYIGKFAFAHCSNLKKLIFKGRTDLNGAVFDKNWKMNCSAKIIFEP